MSNNNLQPLGSIRSGRAGEPHFVPARRQFGIEPRPTCAFAAVLVVQVAATHVGLFLIVMTPTAADSRVLVIDHDSR